MNYKLSLFTISQIRKCSSSKSLNQQKNHYDSLGIRKTATQVDIKNAYYNLSKVYHPDKNQGHTQDQREQHSQKFRDISEAYEVLGNVKTRKMYDKGFLERTFHTSPAYQSPDDPLHKFYRSRDVRTRPPQPGGRQPIYNFDEWSRRHYGESVRRAQDLKERRAHYENQQKKMKEYSQQEVAAYTGIFIIFMCMIFKEANEYEGSFSVLRKREKSQNINDK